MKRGGKARIEIAVFSLTLFTSASIMFAIQPMVGKMLLPLVGGTPAGWIVAMAFFQIMLLAGYLMAHLFSQASPRGHGALYLAGLLAGMLFLPLSLARHGGFDSTPGALQVFGLLTVAVAIPFIALSATSSTIQRLFTATGHSAAGDPYFLYVASNLGSFAGLLLYPAVIEPALTLDEQARYMSGAYAALFALGLFCLVLARRKESARHAGGRLPPPKRLGEWTALAFVPSSLLMGVTTYITTDVISAPMIWIMPLALYLLTFVIAFSARPVVPAAAVRALHPYAICVAIFFISLMQAKFLTDWAGVAFYLAIFTAVALACHMRLAALRPLKDNRQLTAYYLMMSVGGALGGVLNAFIVPYVFNQLIEFPLMLLASFLLHPDFDFRTRSGKIYAALLAVSVLLVNVPAPQLGLDAVHVRGLFAGAIVLALLALLPFHHRLVLRPGILPLAALVVFMVSQFLIADNFNILRIRNFYGTIRVHERPEQRDGKTYTLRVMRHGSTVHGTQVMDPALSREPTAYHARTGPLGDVFAAFRPKKVAVLGLGIGVMNCYSAPDREFTYLELDPDVVTVAEKEFAFLSACVSKKPPRILTGDGRLELGKLEGEKFDMLVMDAFTSDSIPTHLITREAFALYLERLKDGGVIALNISNRYFNLKNTIAATAATLGLQARFGAGRFAKPAIYEGDSLWMVLARPGVKLDGLKPPRWETPATSGARPWTDNYSDLFSTLRFGAPQ